MRAFANQPEEAQCEGKRGYFTKAKAKLALRRMRGRDRQLAPYRCPHCELWHLGGKRR